MPNSIPSLSRAALDARDGGVCCVCGSGNGAHWHHRRSRRVRDAHTHCACVGLTLCRTCHTMVHSKPVWAYARGLLMSVHITEPWTIPVLTYAGWVTMTCDGQDHHTPPPRGKEHP